MRKVERERERVMRMARKTIEIRQSFQYVVGEERGEERDRSSPPQGGSPARKIIIHRLPLFLSLSPPPPTGPSEPL
jgi:hypothetical protein